MACWSPAAKLRVEAMCTRYGVGASPLREALSRLSAEGLVDRTDLRGFSVAPLNWDELPILTQQPRAAREPGAARVDRSARRGDGRSAGAAGAPAVAHAALAVDRPLRHQPGLGIAAPRLSPGLLSRCPSRWLRAFCDSLADEAYRFRQVAVGQGLQQPRDEHAEHVAIFDATIEGRADDAVRLLEEHYTRTAAVVAKQARGGSGRQRSAAPD